MIEITNLCKTYGHGAKQVNAVCQINLKVAKGEIYGIIGYSGAGKSSLIRCINMLEAPTSGSIKVGNQEMTTLKGKALRQARKKIGMVFQHFHLLSTATVYQNIATALALNHISKEAAHKRVVELLHIVGLADKADCYPSQLSGGQKQRVAIARALANDIEVLLCDEATSALDPQTTEAILDLLLEINRSMHITILLITHEMNVIRKICDRVAVIEKGRIIEENTVVNLFTHPKHPTTIHFMNSVLEADIPPAIKARMHGEAANSIFVRFTFLGSNASQPFLSQISHQLNLVPNILAGNILQVKDEMLGCLIVEFTGASSSIEEALALWQQAGITTEVLH